MADNKKEKILKEVQKNLQNEIGFLYEKARPTVVKFEGSSEHPFEVEFSERGFDIDGTRLSFELLEDALGKKINITLNNGNGLVLDAVRMQKIMRYKDRFGQPEPEM